MEPWVLAKRIKTGQTSHAADQDRLNTITVLCYEACRISGIMVIVVLIKIEIHVSHSTITGDPQRLP